MTVLQEIAYVHLMVRRGFVVQAAVDCKQDLFDESQVRPTFESV